MTQRKGAEKGREAGVGHVLFLSVGPDISKNATDFLAGKLDAASPLVRTG